MLKDSHEIDINILINEYAQNFNQSLDMHERICVKNKDQFIFCANEADYGNVSVIGAGMKNLHNSCFLNATIQAIFHVPSVRNWLLAYEHKSLVGQSQNKCKCLICIVIKTLKESIVNSGKAISPFQLHRLIFLICPSMRIGRQEDSQEFLIHLMDKVDDTFVSQTFVLPDSILKKTTSLQDLLSGILSSTVTCLDCEYSSTTVQQFQEIIVSVKTGKKSLETALKEYFSAEPLTYKCKNCRKFSRSASKQLKLLDVPKVLIIVINRYDDYLQKIDTKDGDITFKPELNLNKILPIDTDINEQYCYKFASVIEHHGPTKNSGHYTATAQIKGKYYKFNDEEVYDSKFNAIKDAYIIIYENSSKMQDSTNIKQKLKLYKADNIRKAKKIKIHCNKFFKNLFNRKTGNISITKKNENNINTLQSENNEKVTVISNTKDNNN